MKSGIASCFDAIEKVRTSERQWTVKQNRYIEWNEQWVAEAQFNPISEMERFFILFFNTPRHTSVKSKVEGISRPSINAIRARQWTNVKYSSQKKVFGIRQTKILKEEIKFECSRRFVALTFTSSFSFLVFDFVINFPFYG